MKSRKLLIAVASLSVLLIVPLVFSSGLANLVQSLFSSNTATSSTLSSSSPTVFVTPATVNDLSKQSGSTFKVHVNISDVTDLFAWQINVTWKSNMLSVNKIIVGEFLNRTGSANKTSSAPRYFGGLGFVVNATDNVKGYAIMSESILEDIAPGDVPGITAPFGRLVSIEFLVKDYGSTVLTISLTGTLRTTLLNSTGGEITLPPANVQNGYFRNKFPGDVNGDHYVTSSDLSLILGIYGKNSGQLGFDREADFNLDGFITSSDLSILLGNYGKSFFP